MSRLFAQLVFGLYRLAGRLAAPLLPLLLAQRLRRGKELPGRVQERWGKASQARPAGTVIWVHAASVGESLAVLPLVEALARERPATALLMTSTTVTSARLLAERLPAGVVHQFSPLDLPSAVTRFLDHWQPNLAVFVESELWPTQLHILDKRAVPRVLVNGRMSSRSYRGWQRWPGLAANLLGGFALVTAESERSAERLQKLGAPKVIPTGSLKNAAPPLPAEAEALASLKAAIDERPCWLAASTHPGEETILLNIHKSLSKHLPNLLTLLAPRHPHRGPEIAELVQQSGLRCSRRSQDEALTMKTEIYLADTLGEMGLLYRLAPLVFVGGSLVPVGGHNPLEPARLCAALLAGPYRDNVVESSDRLQAAGAMVCVADDDELRTAALRLLQDPAAMAEAGRKAEAVAGDQAQVLQRTWDVLAPLLPPANRSPVEGRALDQGEDLLPDL